MKVSGDEYIAAAGERIQTAHLLWAAGRFGDSIYLGGVAVECVLRAFAFDASSELESRHDLRALLKAATLEKFCQHQVSEGARCGACRSVVAVEEQLSVPVERTHPS